jgi:NTE family protein
LLETSPLRSYLANALEDSAEGMRGIAENLARGELSAVAVTTTDLSTGRTMTWLQSSRPVTWEGRIHRGVSTTLRVDHLLASLATPVFFPAVRLGNSWHVDGAIRQFAPLLPAMRLGAERILAISCRHVEQSPGETESAEYPPLIQVGGVLLNAVFQTLLDEEVESINQLSAVLEKLPERDRAGLRPGRVLVVRPSRDLGAMAGPHLRRFPSLLGFVARQMTAGDPRNLDLLSSAVFDRQFIGELMELGERDAEAQSAGIEDLLREP